MYFVSPAGSELKVVIITYRNGTCTSKKSAHVFIENVFLVTVMLSMLKLFFTNCFDVYYYDCVWMLGASLQYAGMLQGWVNRVSYRILFWVGKEIQEGIRGHNPPNVKGYNTLLDNFHYWFLIIHNTLRLCM